MDKYTKIKQIFEKNRDEENDVKMSKYMRDLFKFYGLATPIRKSFYKDLLKEDMKYEKAIVDMCCDLDIWNIEVDFSKEENLPKIVEDEQEENY